MKKLNSQDIYAVSAYTIDNNPDGTKALINKYGISLPNNASKDDLDKGFAALMRKSKAFRNEFSALAAETITGGSSNFMYMSGNSNFFNLTDVQGRGIGTNSTSKVDLNSLSSKSVTSTTPVKSATVKTKSSLAQAFDADTWKSIINTGLNVWAASKNTQAATQDVQTGRQNNDSGQGPVPPASGNGIGTTGIVLISVGALAAIGVLIYYLSKPKA